MSEREFKPMILQTKQEIEEAIKKGKIQNSKYNLLDHDQKVFVELVVFADYTGEQAIRMMRPNVGNARVAANRMMSIPEVADTIEELTVAKDKQFVSQLSSVQDMALAKIKYIMTTTKDEAIALAAAKVIMDKSSAMLKSKVKEDTTVTNVVYNIKVSSLHDKPTEDFKKDDKIIIEAEEDKQAIEVNPETGMPYILRYEGVNIKTS